jgi:adenine-specific DNA-methyltransferase
MSHERLKPSFTLDSERIEELKRLVPEAFADGKINWETLKEALGEHLEDEASEAEHFGLFWPGKRDARRMAAIPSKGTLVPVPGEGIDEETTRNIFIEGENLEVLKLLQKSYAGRIKMIYIDPPYNTGNDFVYEDDFKEPLEEYLRRTGQLDEEGMPLSTNTRADGRFHSNWLNMMYPRLRLARNLLSDDGVIFVSIDDNEGQNLRLMLDEIFGEENFLTQIVVQSNRRGQTYKDVAKTHEYLICYSKEGGTGLGELRKQSDDSEFEDDLGKYTVRELRNRNPKFGRFNRPNLYFPIYVSVSQKDKYGFHPVAVERSDDYCIEVFPLNSEGKESCWRWGVKKVSNSELVPFQISFLVFRVSIVAILEEVVEGVPHFSVAGVV